jgi:hypothetical protein
MGTLLNSLQSTKTAYQSFTIEHGIERIKVQIPLKFAKIFEEKFAVSVSKDNASKEQLLKIVSECGGKIRSSRGK